jgi:hypothetical protein
VKRIASSQLPQKSFIVLSHRMSAAHAQRRFPMRAMSLKFSKIEGGDSLQ